MAATTHPTETITVTAQSGDVIRGLITEIQFLPGRRIRYTRLIQLDDTHVRRKNHSESAASDPHGEAAVKPATR